VIPGSHKHNCILKLLAVRWWVAGTSLPHNTSLPEFNTSCRPTILVYCQTDIIRGLYMYIVKVFEIST